MNCIDLSNLFEEVNFGSFNKRFHFEQLIQIVVPI